MRAVSRRYGARNPKPLARRSDSSAPATVCARGKALLEEPAIGSPQRAATASTHRLILRMFAAAEQMNEATSPKDPAGGVSGRRAGESPGGRELLGVLQVNHGVFIESQVSDERLAAGILPATETERPEGGEGPDGGRNETETSARPTIPRQPRRPGPSGMPAHTKT